MKKKPRFNSQGPPKIARVHGMWALQILSKELLDSIWLVVKVMVPFWVA